jgi:hypothetical protein
MLDDLTSGLNRLIAKTNKRHAHMHIISSTQPQKVALIVILPFHLKAEVQVDLCSSLLSSSTRLHFAKLPYKRFVASHHSFKKKRSSLFHQSKRCEGGKMVKWCFVNFVRFVRGEIFGICSWVFSSQGLGKHS